jgi:hypothetical protein
MIARIHALTLSPAVAVPLAFTSSRIAVADLLP